LQFFIAPYQKACLGHCVTAVGVFFWSLGGWLAAGVSGGLLGGVFCLYSVTTDAGLSVCSSGFGGGCYSFLLIIGLFFKAFVHNFFSSLD